MPNRNPQDQHDTPGHPGHPGHHNHPEPTAPGEQHKIVTTTTTTDDSRLGNDGDGNGPLTMNPQTVTVESTPGGIRVRLPTLVLAHVLSLGGVLGGAYQIARPDVDAAKIEMTKMRAELDQLRQSHGAMVERLARIETNTENTRDLLRELRHNR